MSQQIGSIRVKTSSLPIAQVSTGGVKISVNANNPQRVKSFNYLPTAGQYYVSQSSDVVFENVADNNSVLTYDNERHKFVVQNAPRLNGGTF